MVNSFRVSGFSGIILMTHTITGGSLNSPAPSSWTGTPVIQVYGVKVNKGHPIPCKLIQTRTFSRGGTNYQ